MQIAAPEQDVRFPTGAANARRPLWQSLARRAELLALGGILLYALVVRLAWLETVPPNVTADEADNLQWVYRIIAGKGPGPFGLDWKPLPAFGTYVLAGSMSLFGWSIPAMRLPSVILSTAALVPFFLLARRVAGPRAALLAAALLATNAWYLNFSRSGWENVWVALFLLGALLCLELGLERNRRRFFVGAGIFSALGLYGYFAGWSVILILLAYLPLALWRWRSRWRRVLAGYAVLVAVAAALYAPQARTMAAEWQHASQRQRAVTVLDPAAPTQQAIATLWQQAVTTGRAFVLLEPKLPYNGRYNQVDAGVLNPATALLYWAGLAVGLWRWRATALWWLALLVGLVPIQVITQGAPDGARAVPFAPILYLFVALALGEALRRLRAVRWAFPALALLVALVSLRTWTDYLSWMQTPQVAQARQPAVEVAEFPTWQALQMEDTRAGRGGFNVGQWHARRDSVLGASHAFSSGIAPVGADDIASAPVVGRVAGTLRADQPFNRPYGVALDRAGHVYVADTGNARVLKFDPTGAVVAEIGGRGDGEGQFQEPFDLAVDGNDRLYVLDSTRGTVQRFGADGRYEATLLAGAGTYSPRGLALDHAGLLYVADTGRNRVLRVSADGSILKSWSFVAGRELSQPTDVAVDRAGHLYVAEPHAKRLQKFSQDGTLLAERELAGASTREAPHLALAPDGRLVLSDTGAARVGLLDEQLAWVGLLADARSGIGQPIGVAAAASGEVWVVDVARASVLRVVVTSP